MEKTLAIFRKVKIFDHLKKEDGKKKGPYAGKRRAHVQKAVCTEK